MLRENAADEEEEEVDRMTGSGRANAYCEVDDEDEDSTIVKEEDDEGDPMMTLLLSLCMLELLLSRLVGGERSWSVPEELVRSREPSLEDDNIGTPSLPERKVTRGQ